MERGAENGNQSDGLEFVACRSHHCLLPVDEYRSLVGRGELQPQIQTVNAGECLFIPSGCWHFVVSNLELMTRIDL